MPICSIEVPAREVEAKRTLVKQLTVAMQTAFRVQGEYAVFIREYAPTNVSLNGTLEIPVPPICFVECPELNDEVKQVLVKQMTEALVAAYGAPDPMIFLRNYPLDNVAKRGVLHSHNPHIVSQLAALKT